MINNRNIINPYAYEIKKQCILNIAYMVLKIKNDDMEDSKYFKKEYHFVEKDQEIKDVTERIINKLIEDVIQNNKDDNTYNDTGNDMDNDTGNEIDNHTENKKEKKSEKTSFWSAIKIF